MSKLAAFQAQGGARMKLHKDYGWLLNSYFGEDSAPGRRRYRAYVHPEIEVEISAVFGIDHSIVSQSRARLKAKLKSSCKLNQQFE
jgi:hypothetical protein